MEEIKPIVMDKRQFEHEYMPISRAFLEFLDCEDSNAKNKFGIYKNKYCFTGKIFFNCELVAEITQVFLD